MKRPGQERRPRRLKARVSPTSPRPRAGGQLEQQLRAILESADEGIVALDRQGRIELFSAAAERMFGYAPGEVLGRNAGLLLSLDDADAPDAARSNELFARRKDGSTFQVTQRIRERRGRDGLHGWTWFLRDQSERKRLERELLQAQKLAPMGRLATSLAHEYKNLLMGIHGLTHMALDALSDSPARPHLEEIRDAVGRGSTLAEQLLACGRRDAAPEARAALTLDPIVAGSARLLRAVLGARVELTLELEAPEARVRAQAGQLEQVLLNLALNAADAMPDGGQLRLRTRRLPQRVALSVQDTGTGMDHATRQRLFEPFFTTKPEGLGTGLGLAVVKRIANQLGAELEVESEPGAGSTFRLLLPLA